MNGILPDNNTSKDWALLVGINGYPNLLGAGEAGNLLGAVDDMLDFANFLQSRLGVDENKMYTVRSPHPEQPAYPSSFGDLANTDQAFINEFENLRNGPNWRQRRLYVYIAGHGFIPKEVNERALLLAEATRSLAYHFAIQDVLNFCEESFMFEEVLLFMDCCAVRNFGTNVSRFRWPTETPQDADMDPPKIFRMFAAKRDQPTREFKVRGKQEYRGIFTQLLLKVMDNAPNGKVTTGYLTNVFKKNPVRNVKHHLENVLELDSDIVFDPYCPDELLLEIFDFGGGVHVDIPLQLCDGVLLATGDKVTAFFNGGQVAESTVENGSLSLELPDGILKLRINDNIEVLAVVSGQVIINANLG